MVETNRHRNITYISSGQHRHDSDMQRNDQAAEGRADAGSFAQIGTGPGTRQAITPIYSLQAALSMHIE